MKKVRKNFVEALETQNSKTKTLTENGAVSYETTGKYLLDFNFKLSQYRNMSVEDIKQDFSKVYFEDPMLAIKFVFYCGDVREGLGERRTFNTCIEWLAENKPNIVLELLKFIPEYTRWDNLVKLIRSQNKTISTKVSVIIGNQLIEDLDNMAAGKPISLCAKWLPSINASSVETRRLASVLCSKLNLTPRRYRKTLSALRKYLDVVEVKMSSNRWDEINYAKVPSLANLKYADAFYRNDTDRRVDYLNSLKEGKTKINASVSQPHEIVRNYFNQPDTWWHDIKEIDTTLEEMWKSLPDVSVEDSLIVRDGSGSMCCSVNGNSKTTCLDVATALTIYCAEHNSKAWRDKFITFSSRPKFVDLSNCVTLRDKLLRCDAEDDCSNTNIEATMRLILNTAIENNLSQDEMPKNIVIISDMQFDDRRGSFHWNKTLFEQIADDYAEAGYKLPKICFWNVCSRNFDTVPMQNNELGLVLCSGFSITNMNMFMSGEIDPYKVLVEQINGERYDPIDKAINNII